MELKKSQTRLRDFTFQFHFYGEQNGMGGQNDSWRSKGQGRPFGKVQSLEQRPSDFFFIRFLKAGDL